MTDRALTVLPELLWDRQGSHDDAFVRPTGARPCQLSGADRSAARQNASRTLLRIRAWDFEVSYDDPMVILDLLPATADAVEQALIPNRTYPAGGGGLEPPTS